MSKPLIKPKSPQEFLQYIKSRKYFKDYLNKSTKYDEAKDSVFMDHLWRHHRESPNLSPALVRYYANIFFLSDDVDDLSRCLFYYVNNGIPVGTSLIYWTLRYGMKEGTSRYKIWENKTVNRLKTIDGKSYTQRCLENKGMTKEEIDQFKKARQASSVLSRSKNTQNSLLSDPLYTKKRSPFSKFYSGISDTFTIDHQNELISKTLGRGRGEHLSKEDRKAFYTLRIQKILVSKPNGGSGVSKSSILFFDSIRENIKCSDVDIRYGGASSSEWWIRDKDNNKKYYFLDFYIPAINLVIEYNGCAWHPKSKNDPWKSKSGLLKMSTEDVWNLDRQKEASIRNLGLDVHYVWDDDLENKVDYFVELINGKLFSNKRL